MTKEELKLSYSMRRVVEQYGFRPNRAGFISCPFHSGDRTASMKIYKDSFHCFGCGANGDIFTFVQRMDNLSFKEAFISLGGEYDDGKMKFSTMRKIDAARRERAKAEKEKKIKAYKRSRLGLLIDSYRELMEKAEPLSELWCYCQPKLEYLLYVYETMEGGEATRGGW